MFRYLVCNFYRFFRVFSNILLINYWVDNNVYIIGGKTNGFTNALDQVNRYDPISGEWDVLAPLKSSRYYHSSCVVQNKIYVIGGSGKTEVEVYDTDKGKNKFLIVQS